MITALIAPSFCRRHMVAPWHPDHPRRLNAIERQLARHGVSQHLQHFDARAAKPEHLLLAHDAGYLGFLSDATPDDAPIALDDETFVTKDSWQAARIAAGAVVKGVNQLCRQQADNVFCAIRPPGHHAEHQRGMGFCLINNAAIAARYAITHWGLKRILIVDIDAHQCNGTLDILGNDPRVLICSMFQQGIYPASSTPPPSNSINMALAPHTTGREASLRLEADCRHAIERHRPELVIMSAGFDGHREDGMTDLDFETQDFRALTQQCLDIAARFSDGRLLSVLEGGYHLESLGPSVEAHVQALAGLGEGLR
ncbi:histone deacetylase family protein [Larsenimonas suaedae]|uniref:Histone deacetylase family protein n=1 Tax=Larsenimonas suaedae TaxID=1851019 RepID=A0ABU1GXT3_9GAMM|nr:histone deacetylase family protein [Larsenimonas suaedae]MCM2971394.1 histone deacetylase family protein [Larsenimonas suaedae]MDR5896650.1 histone deacetylase family protein [Larsenimonas suaedae]